MAKTEPESQPDERESRPKLRARLQLIEKRDTQFQTTILQFSPVYDAAIPDEQRLHLTARAHPPEVEVDTLSAALFQLGRPYYVDFVPAE